MTGPVLDLPQPPPLTVFFLTIFDCIDCVDCVEGVEGGVTFPPHPFPPLKVLFFEEFLLL